MAIASGNGVQTTPNADESEIVLSVRDVTVAIEDKLILDKLSLDLTAPEHLQAWVKVLDQIESGEMPPKDEARPPAEASAPADPSTVRSAAAWP